MIEYTNPQMEKLIDDYIHSERNRDLLKRKLLDVISYEQLAEEFGLSVRHTQTIVYKAQDYLFSKIS